MRPSLPRSRGPTRTRGLPWVNFSGVAVSPRGGGKILVVFYRVNGGYDKDSDREKNI